MPRKSWSRKLGKLRDELKTAQGTLARLLAQRDTISGRVTVTVGRAEPTIGLYSQQSDALVLRRQKKSAFTLDEEDGVKTKPGEYRVVSWSWPLGTLCLCVRCS